MRVTDSTRQKSLAFHPVGRKFERKTGQIPIFSIVIPQSAAYPAMTATIISTSLPGYFDQTL
jgi:hypothetical protein